MDQSKKIAAIMVAAGRSARLPGEVPKVYRSFQDRTVLEHSLAPFLADERIGTILLVVNPEHEAYYAPIVERVNHGLADKNALWVVGGGQTRQESVFNGLDALADAPPELVLVHDAARPHVSPALIGRVLDALQNAPAVVPAVAVKDTIKRTQAAQVVETLPREALCAVQTPQGFHYSELLAAHMAAMGRQLSDDAAVMEEAGVRVVTVEGDEANQKLTTPADWQRLQGFYGGQTRIGQGFDVHRLVRDDARALMLCGVQLASPWALQGHSDADVGLHALVDALLGAIGAGDIGEHFPPSDARWKDADSAAFVSEAMRLLREAGGQVVNADLTLIAEEPKLAPYKAAMRARVAALLGVAVPCVNIKATTTEGLGFTGRREGIAAQAVVSVQCG